MAQEPKWEKVLYKKSGYPDNYTPPNFLKEIKRNEHFQPVDKKTAILKSTRISTQISVTVIFWAVFLQLKEENNFWELPYGAFSFLIMITAYVINFNNIVTVMKNLILFVAIGYGCTPILKTLTYTISTDSIYAMSVFLMLVHIAFHQYGKVEGVFVSPYVSLNAAICGAICLASRLQETKHAFFLLTLAVQAFALFPKLYRALDYTPILFVILTSSALVCMFLISTTSFVIFMLAIVCVNIIFPLCFVWAQKYKNNIDGPWDQARIFNK